MPSALSRLCHGAATRLAQQALQTRPECDRAGPGLLDAAVITTGPEAYRRRDGIAVIPAALLGA